MNIKAVVFDFFGVFYLNSHDVLIEHFPHAQNELEDLRYQSDYGMLDRPHYLQAIQDITGADELLVKSILVGDHRLNQPLIDYARSELKPHYKLGLLSNVGRGWMDNFLSIENRRELFDAVVLSGDEGVTKPHPQIYELIAERLALEPEECVMIDDLPENATGADAAGMHALVYGNLADLRVELKRMLHA